MLSEEQQELLDSFSEVRAIGPDFANKVNAWNESNIDEDKMPEPVTQDMSGDSVILNYTEHGFDEDLVYQMLSGLDFQTPEESDDTVTDGDAKQVGEVDERMSEFLEKCVSLSASYPGFVKNIELRSGTSQRKEEVRIVIPTDSDIRKLPSQNARKVMFMYFLKDIREYAAQFSMIDESMCFCASKHEFWLMFRPLAAPQI